jgi:hypothetical protein
LSGDSLKIVLVLELVLVLDLGTGETRPVLSMSGISDPNRF